MSVVHSLALLPMLIPREAPVSSSLSLALESKGSNLLTHCILKAYTCIDFNLLIENHIYTQSS